MTKQSDAMIGVLPYLRRYARALTGSQERGDRYVRQFLEVVLSDPKLIEGGDDLKAQVFTVFHKVCRGLDPADYPADDKAVDPAMERQIAALPPADRQMLLLVSLEGFPVAKAAAIIGIPETEARDKLLKARLELQRHVGAKVLVIEDETVIAMDIAVTVRSAGHTVVGVADTVAKAIELSREHHPDLVLADIQLKGGDSGLDAVAGILTTANVPVIFVTGFPEALLTGERPEPAFVVTKPFDPEVLTATIGQALSVTPREPSRRQAAAGARR
jgi:CheY-like chemotaxis protein/DNA-directed RNA polymerase specialized sigma24 family protein